MSAPPSAQFKILSGGGDTCSVGIKTEYLPISLWVNTLSSNLVVGIDCVSIVQRDPVIQHSAQDSLEYLSPVTSFRFLRLSFGFKRLTLGQSIKAQRLRPARVDGPTLYACMQKCKNVDRGMRPGLVTSHTYPSSEHTSHDYSQDVDNLQNARDTTGLTPYVSGFARRRTRGATSQAKPS